MFKDSKKQWLTRGLFYELNDYKVTEFTKFTLGDEDIEKKGVKLLSLRRLFVETGDPLEYEFAVKHLGGWSHWQALLNCKPLEGYIQDWRDELEIKIRSEAVQRVIIDSEQNGSHQASKLLIDRGWNLRKAGAPSKAEKEGHKKQDQKLAAVVKADYKRLNLNRN